MTVFISSLAVLLAGLAVQRNVAQDRDAARERIAEAEIEARKAQIELQRVAVEACKQENVSRENQYNDNMALILIVLQNRPDSSEPIPLTIQQYIEFTKAAYEPLNCDYDSENFGLDLTPPVPFPPNPLVGENPHESTS